MKLDVVESGCGGSGEASGTWRAHSASQDAEAAYLNQHFLQSSLERNEEVMDMGSGNRIGAMV